MQNDYCVACNDIDGLVRANNAQAVVQEGNFTSFFSICINIYKKTTAK